jgi:hypothetical protein
VDKLFCPTTTLTEGEDEDNFPRILVSDRETVDPEVSIHLNVAPQPGHKIFPPSCKSISTWISHFAPTAALAGHKV